MISVSDQYHGLINLMKTWDGKDGPERAVIICAYVSHFDDISEKNFLSIMRYANIEFGTQMTDRIIHFFLFYGMMKVRDEGLGLIKTMESIEPSEIYTDERVEYAKKEIIRIGRMIFDG